jgi:hypothetical protein
MYSGESIIKLPKSSIAHKPATPPPKPVEEEVEDPLFKFEVVPNEPSPPVIVTKEADEEEKEDGDLVDLVNNSYYQKLSEDNARVLLMPSQLDESNVSVMSMQMNSEFNSSSLNENYF